jgi:hypothetical protein
MELSGILPRQRRTAGRPTLSDFRNLAEGLVAVDARASWDNYPLVKMDMGMRKFYKYFHSNMARLYKVGDVSELCELCRLLGDERRPMSYKKMRTSITNNFLKYFKTVSKINRNLFMSLLIEHLNIGRY